MGRNGTEESKWRKRKHEGYRSKPEEELLRHSLSIRFRDDEHRAVTYEAWRQKVSASSMVRNIVVDYFKRRGVKVD